MPSNEPGIHKKGDCKILQINVNKSPRAMDLAQATAQQGNVDFIAVSEPNLTWPGNQHGYKNGEGTAGIVNSSRRYGVHSYGTGRCFVWVGFDTFFLYSVYITPNCTATEFLGNLQDLETDLRTKKGQLIITGDFNAKHSCWEERPRTRGGGNC